ncbi:MAG: ATP-binding cassette subfamily B protein [Candidatus Latescibacterota bacterium]|jgi:ATP-binding cassette subfamily B protein
MNKLIDQPVNGLVKRIALTLGQGEDELIRVESDLGADGHFGSQWVVVTANRVLIYQKGEEGEVTDIPIADIAVARTEALIGGARLEIHRKNAPSVFIPFSKTLAQKFSETTRGIEQLRKGQEFFVNGDLDRTHCEKCRRLLPERNGICPACINRFATLGRIAAYLKPYKGRAILLAVASVITTVSELLPPIVTKHIVDDVLVPAVGSAVLESDRLGLLGMFVLALIGIRLMTWAGEWVHGWTITWLSARVTADIRSQLYKRLELLSLQFYDKRQVGAVMSRVTSDSGRLQDFLVDGLPYMVINGLMLLGILIALFSMSWQLTLYVLIPIPAIIAWGIFFWARMRRFFTKWMQAWGDAMSRVNEALTGIRVVKAFAQEKREINVFKTRNDKLTRIGIQAEVNRGVFFKTMTLLTAAGVMIVWYYGGLEVIDGNLTLGTLMAFYSYMMLLYGPLEWFGMVNSWMTRAFAGAERIFEIIDTPPEAYQDPNAIPMPNIKGHVKFRDVTFGYDKSKPVLHDIDLDVQEGEMIGLVGKSGVGKTTTVNLICRFYEVDRGGIEIDGVDVRNIRLEDLRSQIGIVLQEPFLFSGTIADNIGYGRPGATFEDIMNAAKAAAAHDFIVSKADGYDTVVGERGDSLSGGERQRISIARAVLHDPKILILDEATSSVDVQTEKHIQEALARLVKGRTTFAIAHRLSTLRNADRLLVMDAGRIVEMGTHAELLENKGPFYHLVQLQEEISQIIAISE